MHNFREQACKKLLEFCTWIDKIPFSWNGRVERLVAVLKKHPNAVLRRCSDEMTGYRYGNRICRKGRCAKIGSTTFQYQLWAEWK